MLTCETCREPAVVEMRHLDGALIAVCGACADGMIRQHKDNPRLEVETRVVSCLIGIQVATNHLCGLLTDFEKIRREINTQTSLLYHETNIALNALKDVEYVSGVE